VDKSTAKIREDFDQIALLSEGTWDHNSHYHGFLSRHMPPHCKVALDVGCGTGEFSRLLANRSERVIALDLSPEMIRIAQERSKRCPNIDFKAADATAYEFPHEHFDCIVSIAALHHIGLEEILPKMRKALKSNGRLILLDILREDGFSNMLLAIAAVFAAAFLRFVKTGRLREPLELRSVWDEHQQSESYLSLSQVRRICGSILPGATVRRHLLWRYSIIYTKDATS
jgi:ubiquinone/menaquinone biosynthesis C-methylase UbiE